jgi:hypothetical protein
MNRTQAIQRVDEILELFAEMYVAGRCPRCGVALYDGDDVFLSPRTSVTRSVVHRAPCEVASCIGDLITLTGRFSIRLEPVLLTASEPDTSVLTVRRVGD